MLELLERRDDEHFEGFCKALEATGQHGVVRKHLQQYRVCFITVQLRMQCTVLLSTFCLSVHLSAYLGLSITIICQMRVL